METTSENPSKKVPLEDLSKEELVKKCRSLLNIAKNAKQLLEDNKKLKEQESVVSEEVVETLTQQKLDLVVKLDELRTQQKSVHEKLDKCESNLHLTEKKVYDLDIENQSLKRQNGRLSDENAQLIDNLDGLERQIDELKRIGLEQQEQLLILENSRLVEQENTEVENLKLVKLELENEVKIINAKNNELIETLQIYQQEIEKKNKEIEGYIGTTDDLNTEVHKNRALIEKLKQDITNLSGKFNNNQIMSSCLTSDLENTNEKLKERVKLYHSKLVRFAGDVKKLRESKDIILENFRTYNQQVNLWKDQLGLASKRLVEKIEEDYREKLELEVNLAQKLEEIKVICKEKQDFYEKIDSLCVTFLNSNESCVVDDSTHVFPAGLKQIFSLAENVIKESVGLKSDKDNLLKEMTANKILIDNNGRLVTELKKAIAHLEAELESSKMGGIKIAEHSSMEILKLSAENKELMDKLAQHDVSDDSFVQNIKRENSELLVEMNEMNQVLKERGEMIGKQQAYIDEMMKQKGLNDDIIAQQAKTIEGLEKDIDKFTVLEEKLNAEISSLRSDNDDNLSTSTISRSDEVNRLKDLDGSWEEKYGKLRSLAVKLKAKIKELSSQLENEVQIKTDLQGKLANSAKSIQLIQTQSDKLQDDLEIANKQVVEGKEMLQTAMLEINIHKKDLLLEQETISKLKTEIDNLNKEKAGLDGWKKQVSAKVQALKKELEANTLVKKEFEATIKKLKSDLEAKEREVAEEKQAHLQTRSLLSESTSECKKQSVLNLEMQDYEKTVKDLSHKLDMKNELVVKLKTQVDTLKGTNNALNEQNRLLEENSKTLENEINTNNLELKSIKTTNANLERLLEEKQFLIEDLERKLETAKSEIEDLSLQLTKIISDHEKSSYNLKVDKDNVQTDYFNLEQRFNELDSQFKLKESELNNIKEEYQSYKVRAQSVLRQNQFRDVGLEEKFNEETAMLKAQVDIIKNESNEYRANMETLKAENSKLAKSNEETRMTNLELRNRVDESRKEFNKLSEKYEKTIIEHSETVRGLKLHAETLCQCYRQQISEQEVRHNREIIELQSKIEKGCDISEIPPLVIPTMPREEGEGSESIGSSNGNIHPLEKLLTNDNSQDFNLIKKQLAENESKVVHLTSLLADTEQDLAKHVQMNAVLKEEIRRQQRSIEREKHAENLEYMKNVVFKFITLNQPDERLRLVPVLNTILKLSPEETTKLNTIAKGEKGWSNYLPLWSSPTKPS